MLALTAKNRKSQDFLTPLSGSEAVQTKKKKTFSIKTFQWILFYFLLWVKTRWCVESRGWRWICNHILWQFTMSASVVQSWIHSFCCAILLYNVGTCNYQCLNDKQAVRYYSYYWFYSTTFATACLFFSEQDTVICSFISKYRKFPKYSDTQQICCNHSKIWTMWLYHRVMSPNDADGMANSVDPDQTAPVWSGSALFALTCLSENLGKLRYTDNIFWTCIKATLFLGWGSYLLCTVL